MKLIALTLKCDNLLSSFAFNFNLRHYIQAAGLNQVSDAVVTVSDTIISVESPPPLTAASPPPPPPPPPRNASSASTSSRAPPLLPDDGSSGAGGEEAPAGRGNARETGNSTGRGDGDGDNTAPPAGIIALLVVGFCLATGAVYARYLHKGEFKFPGLAVISGALPTFGRGRARAAERYAGLNDHDDCEVEMPSISL